MSVPELEKKIAELNSELEAKIMEVADLREQAIRNVLPVLPEAHFDKRLGLGERLRSGLPHRARQTPCPQRRWEAPPLPPLASSPVQMAPRLCRLRSIQNQPCDPLSHPTSPSR